MCQITGSRRPSSDLPQGGLEVPCTLKFAGEKAFVDKIRTLLMPSPCPGNTEPDKAAHVSSDKKSSHSEAAITVGEEETVSDDISIQRVWLSVNKVRLLDAVIAQKQFSNIQGLMSTLLLSSRPGRSIVFNGLQIIHTRGNHWIVATTIGCTDEVVVFDTLYSTVDKLTEELILRIFGVKQLRMENAIKQKGFKDCGVFAIAIAASLAHIGLDGTMACSSFNQSGMRDHLLLCFENMCLTPFPNIMHS